jgi:RNA polymerase sigma-70 factor (ECF subfamily)
MASQSLAAGSAGSSSRIVRGAKTTSMRSDVSRDREQPLEARGGEHVVGVQELDVLAAGELDAAVVVAAEPELTLVEDDPEPRVRVAGEDLLGVVRRLVVADEQLEVLVRLRERRFDRLGQPAGAVVRRHADRDTRLRRHAQCPVNAGGHPGLTVPANPAASHRSKGRRSRLVDRNCAALAEETPVPPPRASPMEMSPGAETCAPPRGLPSARRHARLYARSAQAVAGRRPDGAFARPFRLGDHLDRLFRAAWALCGSREDAEDLVQETYARVLSRPRVLRNDDDLGYLLRALRNTFLNLKRTERGGCGRSAARPARPRRRPERAAAAGAVEAAELYAAIAALPGDFRDVLVAVDVTGLSYKEARAP